MNNKPKVIVICGPTASGKTGLSIELAKKINGEIISCDSMQIYKDMTIGTAKPTEEEMQGIKHYLIDFVAPDKRYSVADFQKDAQKAIKEVLDKGKVPIVVGGTGLYVDTLIYNIQYPEFEIDIEYRNHLEEMINKHGLEAAYNEAKKVDEEATKKISKNDKKITLLSKVILCFITKLQRVFQDRATCHHAQLHQMPCRILPDIVIEHWHVLDLEREHQLILES